MKKKYVSAKDAISVYDYMEMCGLECNRTKTRVSHEIMMRKLELRREKFPENILSARRISFDEITSESIASGNIIIVKDDYNKLLYYRNPKNLSLTNLLAELRDESSKKKLKIIRNELIKESGYQVSVSGDIKKQEEIEETYIPEKSNRQKKLTKNCKAAIARKYI